VKESVSCMCLETARTVPLLTNTVLDVFPYVQNPVNDLQPSSETCLLGRDGQGQGQGQDRCAQQWESREGRNCESMSMVTSLHF